MKKYRVFYHYNKHQNKMTVHFKKKCLIVDNVICKVECETKWKNTQPKLIMQGFATSVNIENNIATII